MYVLLNSRAFFAPQTFHLFESAYPFPQFCSHKTSPPFCPFINSRTATAGVIIGRLLVVKIELYWGTVFSLRLEEEY